ncbi:MAG: cytochrome c oxidase subunit II [Verrucomicrobiales bacterium]|nr:cytochrome c oxidase subunit II [Verrucomicrobiales bacterium]
MDRLSLYPAAAILRVLLGGTGVPLDPMEKQSTLHPAGREADLIAELFWWMVGGGLVIWAGFIYLLIYSARQRETPLTERWGLCLIVIGGVVIPSLVLSGLLVYGLKMMPKLLSPAPPGSRKVEVFGELWWWRFRYHHASGATVEVANELHLPVHEPVELELFSSNVIHSFWIPSLGGKRDLIPGRVTRLTLTPTKPGVFDGQCAEYCGTAHALMKIRVVIHEREAFDRWLEHQAEDSNHVLTPHANLGRELFLANGCGACHQVRGTTARGSIGPDLTHFASRQTIAAGTAPNDSASLQKWLAHPQLPKPGADMPAYGMLPHEELQAIAAYLQELR